jgi:hypothetical protein
LFDKKISYILFSLISEYLYNIKNAFSTSFSLSENDNCFIRNGITFLYSRYELLKILFFDILIIVDNNILFISSLNSYFSEIFSKKSNI